MNLIESENSTLKQCALWVSTPQYIIVCIYIRDKKEEGCMIIPPWNTNISQVNNDKSDMWLFKLILNERFGTV